MAIFRKYRVQLVVAGACISLAISWISQTIQTRQRPHPHAEIPLQWTLASMSVVGGIHEDQFLYLPFDTHRPGGPPQGGIAPQVREVLERSVQQRLIDPQTTLLLHAYYSRAQLASFAASYRFLLQHPSIADSLRQRQRAFIAMLSGETPWGDGTRTRFIGTVDAGRLARLAVGTFYDLENAANGSPVASVVPRLFTQDIAAMHRLSVTPNPATTPGHVRMMQDTSLALSSRIELARLLELVPNADSQIARDPSGAMQGRAARRDSVYQSLVRGERPEGRYAVLDRGSR